MAFEFVKNVTGILGQTQDKINRQFLKRIVELESKVVGLNSTVGDSSSGVVKKVSDIESKIGDESTEGTILARIKALEDAA